MEKTHTQCDSVYHVFERSTLVTLDSGMTVQHKNKQKKSVVSSQIVDDTNKKNPSNLKTEQTWQSIYTSLTTIETQITDLRDLAVIDS